MRPGANGTVTSWPASVAACSTAAQPPRTIRSASETFFPPDCAPLKSCWICSRVSQHRGQLGRLVDLPVLLRREADPRPVGAAALVGAAEARRRRPGGGDQLRDRQPRVEDRALEGGDVVVVDQLVVDRGHRVLPQLRLGDPRAEVARDRPHVAVQQLVPGLGEGVGELVGVLEEAPGDRLVDRVDPQREVGRQHHRGVPLRRVVRVGHRVLAAAGPSASTASRRPGSWSAPTRSRTGSRGSRCPTRSASLVQAPSSPLVMVSAPLPVPYVFFQPRPCCSTGHPRARGRRSPRVDRAVGLAERVAADDERDRLLVVHRHAAERLADVARPPAGPGCRSGPPGSRRSGPSARRRAGRLSSRSPL